jgi:hypothetical protein
MGEDVRRLHLPNDIRNVEANRFIVRKFTVFVGSEDRLGSDDRINSECFAALLSSVSGRRHFRIATFTQSHVKDDDSIAGLMLLDEQCAGGKLHVAGMCADCENSARGGLRRNDEGSEKGSAENE